MGMIDDAKGKMFKTFDWFAFDSDKRSTKAMLIKGRRDKKTVVVDGNTIYFLGANKEVNVGDVIVDCRNEKYVVEKIEDRVGLEIQSNYGLKTVNTTKITCKSLANDPQSIVNAVRQEANQIANVTINIGDVVNSDLRDVAKVAQELSQKQNVQEYWDKLKHDLDWRYDYEKYQKFIHEVDSALGSKKKDEIESKEVTKVVNAVGGFLGAFVASFIKALLANESLWGQ